MARRARSSPAETAPTLLTVAPPGGVFTRKNHGKGHSYYLDGVKLPGVTTIIREGVPAPALMKWAAKSVAEYVADNLPVIAQMSGRNAIVGALSQVPWDSRDSAGARGTEIHAIAERIHRGEEVEVPENIVGYVDALLRFFDDWQPRDELLERPIVSRKWRYGGTLDLIATLRDGKRWLLDYKTGKSGIWGETALQLAAYRNGTHLVMPDGSEVVMPEVDRVGAIWLRDDGYTLYPVDAGEKAFKYFLWAMGISKFTDRNQPSLIGEELGAPA